MMSARTVRSGVLAALALALSAAPSAAQSLTALRGLGHPLHAAGARAEALGGLGIGLKGLTTPMVNPASAASVARPGAMVAVSSIDQTGTFGDQREETGATRFPLIQVFYPLNRVVLTAGYGSYLDQSWGVIREDEEVTGGGTIPYQDIVQSTGGIGQAQLGVAVPLGSRLALGAAVGLHTGSQRVEYTRLFDSTSVGDLRPFTEVTRVEYSAPMAVVGMQWDPSSLLRVGASVAWGGTLSADSVEGPVDDTEYDLPLRVAAGASGYLGPNLLATVSGRWSGWSSVGRVGGSEPASGAVSRGTDTWEVGGGLEWDNPASRATRSFPLRLGGQYRQLPFTFADEAPTEWFVGGGIGMRVGPSDANPLARVDFTVQRGERSAPGNDAIPDFTETSWRFILSLAVFGN
jgi:hypothetical protein